jgi:pyrroline-5-carboxylate reductase
MAGLMPSSLALVGAGKMGAAMLEGWMARGLDPDHTMVFDPVPSREILAYCQLRRIKINPNTREIEPPQVLVLATKPQTLDAAAPSVSKIIGHSTLVISVLAGKTLADLKRALPNARAIVRAMPNLPVSVRRGVTAVIGSNGLLDYQRQLTQGLFDALGHTEWLSQEGHLDAVTALSGSGPAYVFHLTECLAQAGVEAGLPMDVAERLARATVVGAGELMHQSDLPVAKLRQNVTSPGGTTAAALSVLMGDHSEASMGGLMREAVLAAKRRAEELAG